jgi:hypothetical protein
LTRQFQESVRYRRSGERDFAAPVVGLESPITGRAAIFRRDTRLRRGLSRNCLIGATFMRILRRSSVAGGKAGGMIEAMTDQEYTRKLAELDRLLNDPDVPMQPERVWSLLAEISQRDLAAGREQTA